MTTKLKKRLSTILIVVCSGVFIYAGYGLVTKLFDYYQSDQVVSDVQDAYYNSVEIEPMADASGEIQVQSKFEDLLTKNDELVGWIKVDGTEIDYPILQAEDNEEYLRKDFNKDYNILGSIFMDYRNEITTDDDLNTIIYGHRTKNGAMFEGLTNFLDQEFLDEHPTFTFDTLYESYEAEIFAVYNTLTDFNYIQTDFASTEDFDQLLQKIDQHSLVESDVEVGPNDRIITLSTCDYALDDNNGRLVVQAKLVKKGQSANEGVAQADK